jgi:hypothetical protein
MHGPIRPLLALVLAATLCGCAQTGRSPNPLAWLRKPGTDAKTASTPRPFKPPKDVSAAKAAETSKIAEASASKSAPENLPTIAAAPPRTGEASISHDAETLALIEEELRHASPAEKEKLFTEWKSLDAAMVRQVIRIRKMVRGLDAESPGGATATAALPGTTSPWQAGENATVDPASQVRILPLGANPAPVPAGGAQLGQTLPMIQPGGHNAPLANAGTQATVAYGHSTSPVPVIESLAGITPAGVSANGLPPAAPIVPTPAAGLAPAVSTGAIDQWNSQVRQLIASAEARAEQARATFLDRAPNAPPADEASRRFYVESQVQLRLLYMMAGEQARALQAIPGLEAADQEFWQQVLWGVSNYFDDAALPNRSDRVTQTVEQLRTAITRLQGEANLQLRNVAFCRKITSFGNFERFERDEFAPGDQVLIYAEVLNFKSVPQPADGFYNTQLKSTIEIYRAGQGQPARKIDFDPTIDLCRSYRQDYFHTYDLKIPADLTLGPHVLKLTIEDIQSRKVATYAVNFTVR